MDRILVTGAGGFIGHHLVSRLKQEGHWVRGVDIKLPEFAASDADQFEILDLRRWDACLEATRGIDQVYPSRRIWVEWVSSQATIRAYCTIMLLLTCTQCTLRY